MGDMARNMTGCWIALTLFDPLFRRQARVFRRAAIALAAGLLIYFLWPVGAMVADEWAALRQFPLLSGLESPLERFRWSGSAAMAISEEQAQEGRRSLEVRLTTDRYSGIALAYFPRDWRGFDSLAIAIYNPERSALPLTCRIHDRAHNHQYRDRYNHRFTLKTGWNHITIDLETVRSAPDGREMDLSRIMAVGLFSVRLPAPRRMYVDDVRLVGPPDI